MAETAGNVKEALYPVHPGELTFTPVFLDGKIVPAGKLGDRQIGYLLIDVPTDEKNEIIGWPKSPEDALLFCAAPLF